MSEKSKIELRVSSHIYVPTHEIVPEESIGEILKKYNAKLEQFPYILVSDPAVKEIAGRPGDLIRISRKSPTAGEMQYYRFVVEG
ncbi:MAG: DNA-directed RNA polymerase subunit H [Thaumarchaeota archaeon]|nr:DNA-directed RNA polymerase subunit H [Nitrososphaerota archaeon]